MPLGVPRDCSMVRAQGRNFELTPKEAVLDALCAVAREAVHDPARIQPFLNSQGLRHTVIRVLLTFNPSEEIPKHTWINGESLAKPIALRPTEPCTIEEFWVEHRDNPNPKRGILPVPEQLKVVLFAVRFNGVLGGEILRTFTAEDLLARLHFE